jgi:glycosyltransferase involved in cell wall biosynthesis
MHQSGYIPMSNQVKTILFVVNIPSFFVSHRLPLAIAAKNAGFDVHVATAHGPEILKIKTEGLTHHIIPFDRSGQNLFTDIVTFIKLVKLFRITQPDLVHLVTIKPVIYGGIAARLTGIKSIVAAVSGLGTVFIDTSFYGYFRRLLVLNMYRMALKHNRLNVIFQNPEDRNMFLNENLLESSCTRLIQGSGVKLSDYPYLPEPTSTPVVIMASRLLIDKGVFEFVEAAKILKSQGVEVIFRLVGDSDYDNKTSVSKALLNNWKKDDFIELLGFREDIAYQYANAHIVCLPSYREGLPKSLVEAAACGRAVVTTDVAGCRDAIINEVTGLLCLKKDPHELAKAIKILIDDPNKRKQMGRAGRRLAESSFSIEQIISQHMDIYEELVNP